MTASGQTRTWSNLGSLSGPGPIADVTGRNPHFPVVPKPDSCTAAPYSLGGNGRSGVNDARTATIEPNEIDNMRPRPASPRDAAPPVHPSAPCRRPPACFATPACAATPAPAPRRCQGRSRSEFPRNNLCTAPSDNLTSDVFASFATWYAKSLMATCSSATQEKYHAARRRVLLRCGAVCCGG
jgi:hypothetical protein